MIKNAKDRRENSLLEPDWFDGQMLWVMLRHLRADRRRRVNDVTSYLIVLHYMFFYLYVCLKSIFYDHAFRKGLLLPTVRMVIHERKQIQCQKRMMNKVVLN